MIRLLSITLCMMVWLVSTSFAQDATTPELSANSSATVEGQNIIDPPIRIKPLYEPVKKSLLFSDDDILRIRVALAGVNADVLTDGKQSPPPRRLIQVSGIAYSSANDWMVWINGTRVTPYNGLPEIVDIYVREDYIDLKWFDYIAGKILKIRLSPNQTYDINAGVLLPG